MLLVAHSRNEKADAALPLASESNGKSHTAATHVVSDEESDAELDRYGDKKLIGNGKGSGRFLREDLERRELLVAAYLGNLVLSDQNEGADLVQLRRMLCRKLHASLLISNWSKAVVVCNHYIYSI